MDNLTHTLVGAALGQAGLKRRTALAMPALMIGANLSDVDVLCIAFGEALSCRRGWTHGPIGLLVLPALLTLALLWFDRWQMRRGSRPVGRPAVLPGQLLLLSYVGALSHPLLDLMNNWGIRLLMPFSERWFYGDVLFIVDPWIWLVLGTGIWLSRRRERYDRGRISRPAVAALLVTVLYSGAMAASGRMAEKRVAQQFEESGLGKPQQVLASPVFADPFKRRVVVQTQSHYGFGEYSWLSAPHASLDRKLVESHMDEPAVSLAAERSSGAADFLYWSRFPFATIRGSDKSTVVTLGDARFGDRPDSGMFSVTTTLPAELAKHGGKADVVDPCNAPCEER
ncbi:metal-dependent hydrolase [Stenotrophomonas maltophilia]|nr:metal-dependent hydrolase [Stenotrophomonas maltophilia]MBA0468555.1 metal-dependent hydrolase [Stenotrophomonas maltophilia]MBA0475400.1 metal-dependent hydrolase [Stenotrophomonas maltophilia]MBA0484876.1 metal-dependent hydrolase [Stenotrophomonas maltophilia]